MRKTQENSEQFFDKLSFEDENIVHVSGKIDPISDIEIINTELCLADLETISNALEKANKLNRSGIKNIKEKIETLETLIIHLNKNLILLWL